MHVLVNVILTGLVDVSDLGGVCGIDLVVVMLLKRLLIVEEPLCVVLRELALIVSHVEMGINQVIMGVVVQHKPVQNIIVLEDPVVQDQQLVIG